MTPTIDADASSAAAICLAARSLAGDVGDQDEQQRRDAQARGDANGVAAEFRRGNRRDERARARSRRAAA